ncbi:MAG TPA: SusC/RagA family TonB-linked outer membrane protein [Gemmatimonadaceae bacterium]|jgi:TonB-linked SusC/RagA family outer membrane protein|nr:SusC/RagA family TonB-linked outer membrane protein [Gemmatimonadaceae bacterium]
MRLSCAVALIVSSFLIATTARAQGRTISGLVTDGESGQPLSDVQVVIKGTLLGAHTRDDGRYTLQAQTGPLVLTFRRIGYKQIEQAVTADQTTVDIALARDILKLEETVVTGQATNVTRQNVANAVSTVSADQLSQVQSQTLDQQLSGKVAGADISANSGAPGGGMQIKLRGTSSILGNSQPLFVVDGVIISNANVSPGTNAITAAAGTGIQSSEDNASNRLADLDPNDIENIEILKGPSAAAIYGSKAANGVVLITTKRGHPGKPRITIAQRFGFSALSNELGSRTFDSTAAVTQYGQSYVNQNFVPGVTYDHEKQLAGNRPLSYQTTGSVGGGNDNTKYYASGINEYDGGIIDNTYFRKTSVSGSLDQNLGSKVSLGFSSTFSHTADGRGLTNNDNVTGSFYAALSGIPSFTNLQPGANGVYPNNPLGTSNPLQTAALLHNDEGVYRGLGSAKATWHILASSRNALDLLFVGGADYFQQRNDVYAPPDLQLEQSFPPAGQLIVTNTNNLQTNLTSNLVDRYTGNGFAATTSFGISQETRNLTLAATAARGLSGTLQNIGGGTAVNVLQDNENVVDQGIFAQEEVLLLDERLLLTAGGRADRSSDNANPNTLYFYPKGAASYRIPTKAGPLDEIKFRAAAGASGNEPLYGQKFGELLSNNYSSIGTLQVKGSIPGDNLRPEQSFEFEGGFDATLFHSRATLSVTGYQKRITDLLLQRALAPSFGDTTEYLNGGTMRTRGLEIEANVVAAQTRNLQWTVDATWSKNASIIESLPVSPFSPGGFPTEFGAFLIQQGASPTQIVGNVLQKNGQTAVQKIGDVNPDYRASIDNSITYKGLHMSFLLDASKGQDNINLTELLYDLSGNTSDYAKIVHVNGTTMMLGAYRVQQWGTNTGVYVQDASYIKLREVTLSYDLPAAWIGPLGRVHSVTVNVSARNLLTLTHYQGLDPEVSNFGNTNVARNVDVAPFPPSRTFWFGVSLGL